MSIVDRAKNIILTPKTEWPVVAGEEPNVGQIITGYVLPLALIPAVASLIGWGIVGTAFVTSFTWGLAMALTSFLTAVAGVYISAFVVDALAPNFGSQKGLGRAVQLVAYSHTPFWVCGIVLILPFLSWLVWLAGLYTLYLMYLGLPHTMKTPQDKVVVYLIVSIVVVLVVYFVLTAILTAIFFGIFGLSAMSVMRGM